MYVKFQITCIPNLFQIKSENFAFAIKKKLIATLKVNLFYNDKQQCTNYYHIMPVNQTISLSLKEKVRMHSKFVSYFTPNLKKNYIASIFTYYIEIVSGFERGTFPVVTCELYTI